MLSKSPWARPGVGDGAGCRSRCSTQRMSAPANSGKICGPWPAACSWVIAASNNGTGPEGGVGTENFSRRAAAVAAGGEHHANANLPGAKQQRHQFQSGFPGRQIPAIGRRKQGGPAAAGRCTIFPPASICFHSSRATEIPAGENSRRGCTSGGFSQRPQTRTSLICSRADRSSGQFRWAKAHVYRLLQNIQ